MVAQKYNELQKLQMDVFMAGVAIDCAKVDLSNAKKALAEYKANKVRA